MMLKKGFDKADFITFNHPEWTEVKAEKLLLMYERSQMWYFLGTEWDPLPGNFEQARRILR